MRLHKHEELVEAIDKVLQRFYLQDGSKKEAAAALDALLEAAVRLEVAVTAKDGYPRMVFRMEANDDK